MLLDAQQAGSDNGSETITDRSMHKPSSPSDGITCVAVDAHAGVWLALLLVTSIAGWVIGDLLHTAGLWLIDSLAMPFGVFQPMAARFSSLMGFTMEATSVAVSSLPNVDGLSATTAFSTGMTTSADSISTAVSFVWSMAGHVFRTALSWLFAIVVSIPKALLVSIYKVAVMLVIGIPSAILSRVVKLAVMLLLVGSYSVAYLVMTAHYCVSLVLSTGFGALLGLLQSLSSIPKITYSCLLYQPALLLKRVLYDQLGPVLNSLLLFPIMGVTTRLYHAAVYPVLVLRTALCYLTSFSMLPVKTLAVNMLLYPFAAVREGLSYTAAYLADSCQSGVSLAYEWAVPLVWYCVMPVVIVAIVVIFWQDFRVSLIFLCAACMLIMREQIAPAELESNFETVPAAFVAALMQIS